MTQSRISQKQLLPFPLRNIKKGITEITIVLDIVFGSHRIDKALSTYISDWSRTRIVDKIKNGDIQLNGQQMKPNTILSEGDHISICL